MIFQINNTGPKVSRMCDSFSTTRQWSEFMANKSYNNRNFSDLNWKPAFVKVLACYYFSFKVHWIFQNPICRLWSTQFFCCVQRRCQIHSFQLDSIQCGETVEFSHDMLMNFLFRAPPPGAKKLDRGKFFSPHILKEKFK